MNTSYRFEWRQMVVEPFMRRLSAVAQVEPAVHGDATALLARIFAAVGGLPYAERDWDEAHRARVAERLLAESVASLLKHRFGFRSRWPGATAHEVDGEFVAEPAEPVDVNRAPRAQLEALPVIGAVLAERIVEERRSRGDFRSMDELLERVGGLGDRSGERLAGVLRFADREGPPAPFIDGRLEPDLKALLAQGIFDREDKRLVAALEEIARYVAANPHPSVRAGMKRDELEPDALSAAASPARRKGRVSVLADRAYYAELPGLLQTAHAEVNVCMFYIAMPVPSHPTHKLLDTLAEKAAAGCAVRVLVDQDGKDDPYRSRLINASAVDYLVSNGVEVKADTAERLLHSKFVVIDGDTVVIGSHNWTAGSFFRYADLSLVIHGEPAANCWRARFDELWSRAKRFEAARPGTSLRVSERPAHGPA